MILIALASGKVNISLNLTVNYVRNDNRTNRSAVNRLDLFKGFIEISMLLVTTSNRKHLATLLGGLESFLCTDVIFVTCTENDKYTLGSGNTFAHFSLKVKKTRGVYYIKLAVLPLDRSDGCRD